VATQWDQGNAHFPPTTFQISNIHAGTGVGNVIPGEAVIDFNFRFSTESTADSLKQRVRALLDRHGLEYTLDWTLGGAPFLTAPGALTQAVAAAIEAECGVATQLSTSGGTSDGRFIATICPQVIELGPRNHSIHKIDECVEADDLDRLAGIYRRVLENLLS
jgi:succinyl-diaminopimelate desuccinylase